ncbi:MAG: thermonuclease family protein [Pseudomonadota bacterium]
MAVMTCSIRPHMRNRLYALVALACVSGGPAHAESIQAPASDAYLHGRAAVIDGDTLEIAGNSIRLADIDAPPLDYACADPKGATVPCGQRAALFLKELVGLAAITCIPEGRDSYTREVARCSVKGVDIGAAMVRAGWALARYGKTYQAEQEDARSMGAGLWGFQGPLRFGTGGQ